MNRAIDLRRKAGLYKRLAEIPTTGGHHADRPLLVIAEELESEAEELESEIPADRLARHHAAR
jgi:hypothetical protein